MAVVYDCIVLAVIAIFCIVGWKKGFLSTTLLVMKWILALIVASTLAGEAAEYVYDQFLAPDIENRLTEDLKGSDDAFETYGKFLDSADSIIGLFKLDSDTAESETAFSEVLNMMDNGSSPAHAIAYSLIRPAQLNIIQPICYTLIFVAVLLLCTLAAKLFKVVNHIPVIGCANRFMGIAAGAIYGITVLYLVCAVFALVLSLTHNRLSWFNSDIISQTVLMRHIINASLFEQL